MNSDSQTPHGITLRIKMLSAVVGAGVVIAMGVLTVTVGGNEAHADEKGIASATINMTPPTRTPPSVKPQFKAPPWRCPYC